MRAVCLRKVRRLLSPCQKSSLKFNIFISSSPFSLHTIHVSLKFVIWLHLHKFGVFFFFFLPALAFRFSAHIINFLSCRTQKLRGVCGKVGTDRSRSANVHVGPESTRGDNRPTEKHKSHLVLAEPASVQQQPHPELTEVSRTHKHPFVQENVDFQYGGNYNHFNSWCKVLRTPSLWKTYQFVFQRSAQSREWC